MNLLNLILAQQQGGGAGANGGMDFKGIIMIVAMIVIFYFFMIRPQSKKQKELKKQREAMKTGDRVVTSGGIHGKITNVKETTFEIKIASQVEIEVEKSCVYPVGTEPERR